MGVAGKIQCNGKIRNLHATRRRLHETCPFSSSKMIRQRSSSGLLLSEGPKSEKYKLWQRILPASGKHLVGAFSDDVIWVYVTVSPKVASVLVEELDDSNNHSQISTLTLEKLFGPLGSRVHISLDFLNAVHNGVWKSNSLNTTIALCVRQPFMDLLLRKAVRSSALPTAASSSSADVIRTTAEVKTAIDSVRIAWQSARRFDGTCLLDGCLLLSLVVSGGWLRRLFTKGDGNCGVVNWQEMARFFDQEHRNKLTGIMPKQRHYQPNKPRPPHSRVVGEDVKWTHPHWVKVVRDDDNMPERKYDELLGWGKAAVAGTTRLTTGLETKGSQDLIEQLGLCDLVYLMSHQFDKDRKTVVRKALQSGVRSIVILPTGPLEEQKRVLSYVTRTDLHNSKRKNIYLEGEIEVEVEVEEKKTMLGLEIMSMPARSDVGSSLDVHSTVSSVAMSVVFGVHPDDAKSWGSSKKVELKNLLLSSHKFVCGLGICGLDFHRMLSSEEYQMICFRDQLELAKELNLTAVITEKWASEECLHVLADPHYKPSRCVLLDFNGTADQVEAYLDLGVYIGINGTIANAEKGKGLRALLRRNAIPLERLVVFTGAPFHHPRNRHGQPLQRGEIKYLKKTIKTVAKCTGRALDEIRFLLAFNFTFLFRNNQVGDIFGQVQ
jgi:TatD DNase family protein